MSEKTSHSATQGRGTAQRQSSLLLTTGDDSCNGTCSDHSVAVQIGPPSYHTEVEAPTVNMVSASPTHLIPQLPCMSADGSLTTILGTCVTCIQQRGSLYKARAMLDSGSGWSFITARLVNTLWLTRIHQPINIRGFQEQDTPPIQYRVDFDMRVPDGTVTILKRMRALVVESITGDLPSGPLPGLRELPYIKDLRLADPTFDKPGRVDLLLGVDMLPHLLSGVATFSNDRKLQATETAYGWVISGSCRAGQQVPRSYLCVVTSAVDQQTQDLIIGFLQSESLAADDPAEETPSEEVQRAELDFVTNHSRLEDGRFVVTLPRKLDPPPLGHSRDRALRRHHHNAASLTRKGKYREFREAIWDYAKKLHAEKVPPGELYVSEHLSFYMPTHGVVKPQSTTTKLRIVFDASAKTSSGASLNCQLLPGPNLYPNLVPILLQFWHGDVGLTADIGQMFREIALAPQERDYHRFLMENDSGLVEDWRMLHLTFGVASSPFLATRVHREAASIYREEFPRAAVVIDTCLYVDDCILAVDTISDAISLRVELNFLLSRIGMVLRKWRSSSTAVTDSIPPDLRERETSQLLAGPRDHHKTLGIHWDTSSDSLHVASATSAPILHPTK